METGDTRDLRPSPIAGYWYPGRPSELAAVVDGYLDAAAPPRPGGALVALVAPHAGYCYSGAVAGHAFAQVRGASFDVIAVIGPMHEPAPGAVLTSGHRAWGMPLGVVEVDGTAVRAVDEVLRAELGTRLVPLRNDAEHSVEIELPFLQRALGGAFRFLPLMVREQRSEVARALGRALASALRGRRALLVASTDLSHYYPQAVAHRFDTELLRRLEAFDPDAIVRAQDEEVGFACGRGALAAVLWAARELGATSARVLHYATSGDASGDYDRVVGYAAALVTGPGAPPASVG